MNADDRLDRTIEKLIATCSCDACDRYRKALASATFELSRSLRNKRGHR